MLISIEIISQIRVDVTGFNNIDCTAKTHTEDHSFILDDTIV